MADLKGLKMRCLGDGGKILANMDVATVLVAGGEIYESMQRGVINAFEYSGPSVNWSMAFQEVADYMYISPSRAPTDCFFVGVNKAEWDKLPADLQKIVELAVRTELPKWYSQNVVLDAEYIQKFVDYGTEVSPLPKDIEEELAEVAADYYDELAAGDAMFAKVLQSQREFKALCELQGIR